MNGERYGLRAQVFERWLCRYPGYTPYVCALKGCAHKKRNGRCGLQECRLEIDEQHNQTGRCLDFEARP
jgi:hypothetical protein